MKDFKLDFSGIKKELKIKKEKKARQKFMELEMKFCRRVEEHSYDVVFPYRSLLDISKFQGNKYIAEVIYSWYDGNYSFVKKIYIAKDFAETIIMFHVSDWIGKKGMKVYRYENKYGKVEYEMEVDKDE